MKSLPEIGLDDVTAAYNGAEGDRWQLAMGQPIHIGGYRNPIEKAGCDLEAAAARTADMEFVSNLAPAGKLAQGRLIARRR